MRVKKSPKRTVRIMNTKQIDNDVMSDSVKESSTFWENLSKPCQGNSQINERQYSGMWDVLDLTIKGSSSHCYQCWGDTEICLPLDYTAATLSLTEPIDLSTKTRGLGPHNCPPPSPTRQTKEFKDTFLYKMLTDPVFAENLKVTKNSVTYSCPFCKKQFPDESSLALHQKPMVNEANKIACCACDKTFTQKRYLRYHQRSHSERTKYTCDICTKKYSRQDNLTRHNTFHTNPDKFPCNYCDRTFSRKDLLNKHIKGHENRFSYHCGVCDKYFKGPLSLDNHQRHYHKNIASTKN